MLEITFNTNAWLGLQKAQTYGDGEYKAQGKAAVMFYGKRPGILKQKRMQKELEKMQRRNWEEARPLGGKPQDVFRFELMLSMGHIAGNMLGDERKAELHELLDAYDHGHMETDRNFRDGKVFMEQLLPRVAAGEPVRIWYSENADDYCGLLWFASELCRHDMPLDNIFIVKVPEWGNLFHGNIFFRKGTEEVGDEHWHHYVKFQQQAPANLINLFVQRWSEMQEAGTSLRAVVNGQPVSVPDDFYDGLIQMAIDSMDEEFRSIRVLGWLISHGHRIHDCWLLERIEKFIEEGKLIKKEQDKDLEHHCVLKKSQEA